MTMACLSGKGNGKNSAQQCSTVQCSACALYCTVHWVVHYAVHYVVHCAVHCTVQYSAVH